LIRFRARSSENRWQGIVERLGEDSVRQGRHIAMSYQPIENYGIIGNMRTVALVGMNGSIDWYCYSHFDSPSVFGAILDDKKGGRFQISADSDGMRRKRFYWPSTNVLVTRFLMADGIAELEDFMS
jgi:GH15 family glucan-1,4-alpha-glucosidase